MHVHDPLCNFLLCSSITIDIKVPFLLFFLFTPLLFLLILHFPSCTSLTLFLTLTTPMSFCWKVYLAPSLPLRQMNLPYLGWASQSAMTNSEGVPVIYHQAAPALPLDQSCLPEESASATRAHSNTSCSSHHSSPSFSNTMPEFMESVIDSVRAPHRGIVHPVS